jgi:hypothetical protein
MSKRYPGNFITGNPVALTQSSNNGVWDLKDQYQGQNTDTWQEASGIYAIPRSLRFRRSATAYLSKTMGVPTNNKVFTYSGWVKLALTSGGSYSLFSGHNTDENNELWFCWTSEKFILQQTVNGSGQAYASTNAVFRDPSAWYHVVVALDSTQAVPLNRIKLYVNGVQQTFASYSGLFLSTQNFTPWMNYSGAPHRIGQLGPPNNGAMDGYMAELNFVDGQQLDPSYFGYFDPITNIWQPKKYTGTYGNNGFYLPFTENQSTAQLGKNFGNGSNYLTYSEQFNNGNWSKPAAPVAPTISADATAAPNGTTTADAVVFSGSTTHPCYQEYTVSVPNGQSWTASMYVKQATGTSFNLQCTIFGSSGVVQDGYNFFTFDAANKITSSNGGNSYMTVGSQHIGNGWHRVWATNTNQSATTGTYVRVSIGQQGAPTAWSIYCWGAQLTLGTTLLPYTQTVASIINNDWTTNFISLTAGSTYDSMVDSPTNVFTSATDIGGVVPGNYPTLNPLNALGGAALSNGNLSFSSLIYNYEYKSTQQIVSGKYYWEVTLTNDGGNCLIGISGYNSDNVTPYYPGSGGSSFGYDGLTGNKYRDGSASAYGNTFISGNVIGVAYDADSRKLWFSKNNVWQASGDPVAGTNAAYDSSTIPAGIPAFWPAIGRRENASANCSGSFNFGQRPFTYAPPTGFKSLNTTNIQALGTSAVGKAAIQANKWMDISLYGGTATARNIVNSGFQPDLIWQKSRSDTTHHRLVDSVRGSNLELYSSLTNTEGNSGSDGIINFNNNGFSLGGGGGSNAAGTSYVAWQWKQSPTSGFNILSWTGTGVARSISHNLGVAPRFMIIKQRTVESRSWPIYHAALDNPQSAIYLDSTAASFAYTAFFNNQAPDSNSIYLGTDATVNQSGSTYIGYVWAEVPGFSKFGSYTGNGSTNGPFIYTGFRPRWIMLKVFSGSTGNWEILDTSRNTYNQADLLLLPSSSNAESNAYGSYYVDFVSNGFKIRGSGAGFNGSGEGMIYAAFAESPFGLNNRAR